MHNPELVNLSAEKLLEAGEAFAQLGGIDNSAHRSTARTTVERYDVIVIGGGQAGLSVGYHLKQAGVRFLIIDAHARIGDAWRKRWDSLRLFTPAWLDGLDGLPFPGPSDAFPTKDEMADYLEAYAAYFRLPVRTSTKVDRLSRVDGRFVVQCGDHELHADQVVIAMAGYQRKHVPEFARELRPDVVQLHSSDYRNPAQLAKGAVLIVGVGNSGAEIAHELAATHRVHLVGRDVGEVPINIGNRLFATLLMRVFFHRVVTIRTPIGKKMGPEMRKKATPLIRTKRAQLARDGVERLTLRVAGMRDGQPVLDDGRVLDVQNVVWCTGYNAGQSWIDLPIFDDQGLPQHEAGVVTREPGLYFVGLPFLYSVSSSMVHGVGRDAARIAAAVAARTVRALPSNAGLQPQVSGA